MKLDKNLPTAQEVTPEVIKSWKAQYGEISQFKCEDKVAYFKKPDRKALSYATTAGGSKDPFKFNEIILNNCFIGGDKEVIENDEYFLTINGFVSNLIEVKTYELVKL